MIVNALRSLVKSAGGRLPACSTEFLPARALAAIPPALSAVATPLVEQIGLLNAQVDGMDLQMKSFLPSIPRSFCCAPRPAWDRSSPPRMC